MLLVLDNCEHLVAACAALVQRVIGAAPGVRVLAASREGLSVPGERTVTVRSLSFPPPGSKLDPRALDACEAVRLFVERARLSVPKFSLGDDSRDAVAEICRRLDGIPLAIELAAARVKMLSVEEIRARLDDRFRLLTGGSKTAMARQQTLLATIQWSYDHLAPDQQQLLQRLSVFVGGWTLSGAVHVAGESAGRVCDAGPALACGRPVTHYSRTVSRGARRATRCWKRCASTRRTGCTRPARTRRRVIAISSSTWRSRRRPNRSLSVGNNARGSHGLTRSAKTFWRRMLGAITPRTAPSWGCSWSSRCVST